MFCKNFHTLSIQAESGALTRWQWVKVHFFTTIRVLVISGLLDSSHSHSVRWYLTVVWYCFSLTFNEDENSFKCLLAICMSFVETYLFINIPHFFGWGSLHLVVEICEWFICILVKACVRKAACDYFHPFHRILIGLLWNLHNALAKMHFNNVNNSWTWNTFSNSLNPLLLYKNLKFSLWL